MHDPLEVSIGHKNQTNENIDHVYYLVKERDRYETIKRLIDFNPSIYGLIFCRTRNETANVAEKLAKEGYNAEPLHGDLTQAMRDRVMDRFRSKELQILVATDVAARGLDIDNITHVINYNLPDDIENYTHRSVRTARAGKKGESLVLVNVREMVKIKAIERKMRTSFRQGEIPGAEEICEIQLMKLIQLPTQAFEQRLKEEMVENPALESGKEEEELYEKDEFDNNDDDYDDYEGSDNIETDEINIDEYLSNDETPEYKLQSNNYSDDDEAFDASPVKVSSLFKRSDQPGRRGLCWRSAQR
jgi:superfamily II DNA/RNA helicase